MSYDQVAAYEVRNIIWKDLIDWGMLDITNYYADGFVDPLIAIIPAQQIPEFNNNLPGKTYIVYDISIKAIPVQWWMMEETITLDVVSRDAKEIQKIINFLIETFRRYDVSAREIGLSLNSSVFNYYYFKIDSADPVQSFQHEGGFMNGTISISYGYSRETNGLGRYL
jgi:hypothetical protein